MQRVFVLDKNKQPLMPCTPARAKDLLKKKKAAVYRMQPFTIILKDREGGEMQPIALKLDPGSKTTGLALVATYRRGQVVVWGGELGHRGAKIKAVLLSRKASRRNRRARHTRYRAPRFNNRPKPQGWLPPSLLSRADNLSVWVGRLRGRCPITHLSMEFARFDLQAMQNPEISGVGYQQGTLLGHELREYLLEKLNRTCVYCGAQNIPLQIDHIKPRARGGSDRVSNLTLSCGPCNQKKGAKTATEFGHPEVEAQAKKPLKDAAALNATRWEIYRRLKSTGLPLEIGTGGRTKFNRTNNDYPKAHWIDAACVGASGALVVLNSESSPLGIKAVGWGNRQMMRVDKYGFPRGSAKSLKFFQGFQTGDLVIAAIPFGKYRGIHRGVLAGVRATGILDIKTKNGKISTNIRNFTLIQKMDGYTYTQISATGAI